MVKEWILVGISLGVKGFFAAAAFAALSLATIGLIGLTTEIVEAIRNDDHTPPRPI